MISRLTLNRVSYLTLSVTGESYTWSFWELVKICSFANVDITQPSP